jgi:hypothetical protein
MAKDPKQTDREVAEDVAERRFNQTLRNLLNTPHKPHKDKGDSKPERKESRGKDRSVPSDESDR